MERPTQKLLALLLGLSLSLAPYTIISAQSLEEQTVLAALAMNIVRFTTWPVAVQTQLKDALVFCVVGNNVVQDSFADIDHKAIGNKILQVVNLSRLRNLDECHVLYVSELKQSLLLQVFIDIKKRPLLTIGEGYDFVDQGGMIGLENVDGKITVHVNLSLVRESNLTISARLLKLAKIIGN